MNLSDEDFIKQAENFTGHIFNEKNDVREIIDAAFAAGKEKEFDELIFTAKYLRGLIRVIKKAPGIPEVENVDKTKEDISENFKKITGQLRSILSAAEDKIQNFFEEKYLALSAESIANLNLLLEDLEAVKKYSNFIKRTG